MNFELIHTNKLTLRKIDSEVLEYVHKNYKRKELADFYGTLSNDELEKNILRYKGGLATYNKKFLYFQLLNNENNKVIGWCGYHTWYIDHNRAELGYWLYEYENRRKGLMTQALVKILNYGFEKMNLHRIEAFISPNNDASLAIVKKFHFVKEGVLKEHYCSNGKYEDSEVHSLLKKNYNI